MKKIIFLCLCIGLLEMCMHKKYSESQNALEITSDLQRAFFESVSFDSLTKEYRLDADAVTKHNLSKSQIQYFNEQIQSANDFLRKAEAERSRLMSGENDTVESFDIIYFDPQKYDLDSLLKAGVIELE